MHGNLRGGLVSQNTHQCKNHNSWETGSRRGIADNVAADQVGRCLEPMEVNWS